MINKLKSKLNELDQKKKKVKPEIDELNIKKEEEIQKLNEEIQKVKEKYQKLILEVSSDVEKFERETFNDLLNNFLNIIMEEFDAKRSMSEYIVTNKLKEFRNYVVNIQMFPKELIDKLDKIIKGTESIENLAYDIDNIKKRYLKA